MHWLRQRLKTLNFTQRELSERLAARGIKRGRAAISSWMNGQSIPLLANPGDASILAEVLDWTVAEMLIAAGYPIAQTEIEVPEELLPVIVQLSRMDKTRRELVVKTLLYGMSIWANVTDDEMGHMFNGADSDDDDETDDNA